MKSEDERERIAEKDRAGLAGRRIVKRTDTIASSIGVLLIADVYGRASALFELVRTAHIGNGAIIAIAQQPRPKIQKSGSIEKLGPIESEEVSKLDPFPDLRIGTGWRFVKLNPVDSTGSESGSCRVEQRTRRRPSTEKKGKLFIQRAPPIGNDDFCLGDRQTKKIPKIETQQITIKLD